jgi:hypothetical protein
MASITERIRLYGGTSYRVLIRKKGVYLCKTFHTKKEAILWVTINEPK